MLFCVRERVIQLSTWTSGCVRAWVNERGSESVQEGGSGEVRRGRSAPASFSPTTTAPPAGQSYITSRGNELYRNRDVLWLINLPECTKCCGGVVHIYACMCVCAWGDDDAHLDKKKYPWMLSSGYGNVSNELVTHLSRCHFRYPSFTFSGIISTQFITKHTHTGRTLKKSRRG